MKIKDLKQLILDHDLGRAEVLVLLHLADGSGTGKTHQGIANDLGVARPTVTAAMKTLTNAGLVRPGVYIPQPRQTYEVVVGAAA